MAKMNILYSKNMPKSNSINAKGLVSCSPLLMHRIVEYASMILRAYKLTKIRLIFIISGVYNKNIFNLYEG